MTRAIRLTRSATTITRKCGRVDHPLHQEKSTALYHEHFLLSIETSYNTRNGVPYSCWRLVPPKWRGRNRETRPAGAARRTPRAERVRSRHAPARRGLGVGASAAAAAARPAPPRPSPCPRRPPRPPCCATRPRPPRASRAWCARWARPLHSRRYFVYFVAPGLDHLHNRVLNFIHLFVYYYHFIIYFIFLQNN